MSPSQYVADVMRRAEQTRKEPRPVVRDDLSVPGILVTDDAVIIGVPPEEDWP